MDLHNDHIVLKIDDEESLAKENITLDNEEKDFIINIEKLNNLNKSIENEIIEIDKIYEKVDNDITKAYILKREKLIKEENDIKEELKTKVTKFKANLEMNLSKANELLKKCDKISKCIKILEKEEKNMLKIVSYISHINKNINEIKIFSKELMKNVIISFDKEENELNFEEYYFNGIPIPHNIRFKEIGNESFRVFWKIEKVDKLNIDKFNLNYIIDIRKRNSKEKSKQINVDNKNTNCLINNLEIDTNYKIRICSIYNDIMGPWSEFFKIRTGIIDSVILNKSPKRNEFLNKLYEWIGEKKFELLYRGTRDGSKCEKFHNKCDEKGPTICLCKNEKGNIFGGYATSSWKSYQYSKYEKTKNSFLFSLTNIYGIEPTKFPLIDEDKSLYFFCDSGPTFGEGKDLYIGEDYLTSLRSESYIGKSYQDVLKKGCSIFTGDPNNNNHKFKLKELEVFKVCD